MHLGLGTAAIGRPHYINIKPASPAGRKEPRYISGQKQVDLQQFKDQGLQVLNYAYDSGVRYFDTAPGYGMAEAILIEWVHDKNDPEIEIATKWGYTYTANFEANAKQHEIKEHSIDKLIQQWEQSKNLLPYLSTYQIHSATFESGVLSNEPVLRRLAEIKEDYGLRIGLTTSGPNQLEVLDHALNIEVGGIQLFDIFQVTYNILEQGIAPIFKNSNVRDHRFVIKEAIANGRLFPNQNYQHYQPLYHLLTSLANKYDTGIDAVALRFCMDSIEPFMVLSGAAQVEHLKSNLEMNDFELAEEEMQSLAQFIVPSEVYWKERSSLPWN